MQEPPDVSDETATESYQDVYEQYWLHARHVENQVWSFTRIWALILTGIFTVVGSGLPNEAKAATAGFGAVLSLLGFFTVYSLRVPFLAFALTSEVIAINEFGLAPSYRRFFKSGVDFRDDKGIDMPDILLFVYGVIAAALVYVAGGILGYQVVGAGGAGVVGVVLAFLYYGVVRSKFTDEKRRAYGKIDEGK